MTLNCIQWKGCSSGGLKSVEYTFMVITSKSSLSHSGCTRLGHIYWLNRNVWSFIKDYYY